MDGFALGVIVGVLINLVTALFSRKHAVQLIPWLGLYIAVHGMAVLVNEPPVRMAAMKLAAGSSPRFSYPAVIIVVSLLATLYWWGVNTAVRKLDRATEPSSKQDSSNPSSSTAERPPTLHDLFKKDFSTSLRITDRSITIKWKTGTALPIEEQLYLDFDSRTKFVGYYIPTTPFSERSYEACLKLSSQVQKTINYLAHRQQIAGGYRNQLTNMNALVFSGRVFLYHDDVFTIPQEASIIDAYKRRGYDVQMRGPQYLEDQVTAWDRQHVKE